MISLGIVRFCAEEVERQTDTPEANLRKNARDLLRIQRRFMYAKREDLALKVKELRDVIGDELHLCGAIMNDCGHDHHADCYCQEDQGGGYTFDDEYGSCDFCLGKFTLGTVVCAGPDNITRKCPVRNEVRAARREGGPL